MTEDMRSRVENILNSMLGKVDPADLLPAQSRVEAILMALDNKIDELGDLAGKLPIHICTSGEYNQLTGIPTIENPEVDIFYLVPDGTGNDLYTEWIYTGDKWEYFGEKSQRAIDAADEARESATSAAESAAAAQAVKDSIPADYTELSDDVSDLKSAFDNITVETRNLWQNGNINIDSTGYTQFLLKKPLPAGTYTLSGVVTSEATDVTYCVMRFSAVQNPASISTFIADAKINHTGTRQSVSFTLTETAYTVRMQSNNTLSTSSGFSSNWIDLQIETGATATNYIQPFFPVDLSAIRSSGIMVTANNMASTYPDFDDLPSNEIIGVNAGAIAAGMAHAPTSIGVEVVTYSHIYDGRVVQIAIPFNFATSKYIYIRSLVNRVWTDWVTVNMDNNYMGYDLVSDGTQSNRSADIINVLALKKTCRLGPGNFYVDIITINAGKTIVGCGNATQIIRLPSSSYKYTVRLTQKSSLCSVALLGSTETISPSNEWNIWDSTNPVVCGVRIEGTGSGDQEFRASIDNVSISGFAGPGIFVRRTGMATSGGCLISNCYVTNCNVGIVLADYAEYHRITGCLFQDNYYGTINNGGNNVFANCDFSDNVCGVLMDNSSGTFGNSSHGSFVGCTFNHIGVVPESGIRSGGNAIELNTMVGGEMFVGCNVFYGNVSLTASQGIVFNSCNFGSQTPLNITGGNVIMFNSCVFRSIGGVNESPLTLTDNTATKVNGCYYISGREATVETLSA